MNKKILISLSLIVALALAAAVFVGVRLYRHGKDITGVTTLPDTNTVVVNGKSGGDFVSGTGFVTVGEGQKLHLDYDVKSGSFEVFFNTNENVASTYESMDVESLPTVEQMTGEGSFGSESFAGKGAIDYEAEPGTYTVYIVNHDMVGKATVTAK